jgi:DNA-binding IclR family transcriptional regulator
MTSEKNREETETQQDRHFVTALARGLTVLEAFRPGEATLSNQQLATRTGLPKSTVSRLTYTLTRLNYLSQAGTSGGYQPGLAALSLSSSILACFDLRRVAAPLMRAFALEQNVSVSLGMLDGTDIVYLETCRSQARVSVQLTLGSRVPVATTAIGRACYNGLSGAEQDLLRQQLSARYQTAWPRIEERLEAACAEGRHVGYCASFGEYEPEVMAIGVALPALGPGQPAMGLNASAPAFTMDEDSMRQRIAPALLALRNRILPTR